MADDPALIADSVAPLGVGEHRIGRGHTCVRCGKRFGSFDHAINTHCAHRDGQADG
jgi:hypothetical protein